jgi:predicted AAA+ superfamily ATPase
VIDQDRKPCRFILLGSASPDLLFMSSESLSGRIVYTELTPFLICETGSQKPIQDHWLFGDFPQPFLIEDESFRHEWYRSFFLTYIERDFRMLGLGAAPENLSRFFSMLAHIHGNLLNKNMLANSLGINQVTVNSYLAYFKQSFLVRELPSWYQNIGKRLVKSPKLYIRDSGLLHYLLKIKDINQALGHPALGFSWEGFVIEQIISCIGDAYEYFFYRTHDGAEADLVITHANKPKYTIEIKFSNAPKLTKGFTTAINDLETSENFILVPEVRQPFALSEKVMVQDLKGFLQRF